MNTSYPIVVVGCGGLGSAACHWLAAEAGSAVLGLEQFALGHSPRCVAGPLAHHPAGPAPGRLRRPRPARLRSVARGRGRLRCPAGRAHRRPGHRGRRRSEQATDTGTRNIAGYADVLRHHGVAFELLDADEITARWPQFRLAGGEQGIYQSESGIVDAAKANATHVALARAAGATIRRPDPGARAASARRAGRGGHGRGDVPGRAGRARRGRVDQRPAQRPRHDAAVAGDPGAGDVLRDAEPAASSRPAGSRCSCGTAGTTSTDSPCTARSPPSSVSTTAAPETTAQTRTFDPDPVREQRQRDFLAAPPAGFRRAAAVQQDVPLHRPAGPTFRPRRAARPSPDRGRR